MTEACTMSCCKFQAEARFREELASVNITTESRMFSTEDDPIETTDLFVSALTAIMMIYLLYDV